MLVKFKWPWFAPTEKIQVDKIRSTSGRLYRAGTREVPNELKPFLPSSVEIIDELEMDDEEEPKENIAHRLNAAQTTQYDLAERHQEEQDRKEEEKHQILMNERMAKMRAAKRLKKEAEQEE